MKDTRKHGQLFHAELRSADPAGTGKFVAEALGWTVHDTPNPDFKIFETPGGFEGHIGPVPEEDSSPSAVSYVLVTDIAAAERAIVQSGGTLRGKRQEAPGRGLYTSFEMPGGIRMVAWQNL